MFHMISSFEFCCSSHNNPKQVCRINENHQYVICGCSAISYTSVAYLVLLFVCSVGKYPRQMRINTSPVRWPRNGIFDSVVLNRQDSSRQRANSADGGCSCSPRYNNALASRLSGSNHIRTVETRFGIVLNRMHFITHTSNNGSLDRIACGSSLATQRQHQRRQQRWHISMAMSNNACRPTLCGVNGMMFK